MNNNTIPADVIQYQADFYNQFGKLPTNYVECTVTGESYTLFGNNLKKRVEKAGSIEALLNSFVGRGAKAKIKTTGKSGRTEAKVSIKTT
jgi:hypothetical protein